MGIIITSKTQELSYMREDEDVLSEIQDNALASDGRTLEFPSLYFVRFKNPYLKMGTFVRRCDDGYEECIMGSTNGRAVIDGYRGPIFPHGLLSEFLQAVMRYGIDSGSARQDRRRAMSQIGG